MADSLTHRDLGQLCGVSETTIKSYRRKFPGYIPVLSRGKPIRFRPEAGEVCLRIRQCFDKGLSVSETQTILAREFRKDSSSIAGAAPAPSTGGASTERLDEFFKGANRMMQGMAALATAQAKSDRRLEQVENGLARLVQVETANQELLGQLMRIMEGSLRPKPAPRPAKKIVTVRDGSGQEKSYAFDAQQQEEKPLPAESFLDTPVVIQNDQGDFLGLPGGLHLRAFATTLAEHFQTTETWHAEDDGWRLDMDMDQGEHHALHFRETTTPKGNRVIHFHRFDARSRPLGSAPLQDLFRQCKGWL